ncbi:family 10 glycosylhydrolase [candidate division KSB1 bacterium]|nr:family 10 glycosylhydrolase [candidate division KSB1 bacterium]
MVLLIACQVRAPQPDRVRGVWLTNVDSRVLDSRESIAEAMQFLADHHFNVVFPVVWNNAYTLYPSAIMDSLFRTPIDPRFAGRDPLAEVIIEAHRHDIAVIPWFEYGFAASHKKNGGRILERYPHWSGRDAEGNLLSKNGFEWMNGWHPEVQDFILGLVEEVVDTYDVDGVQGDDRLPAMPAHGGYAEMSRMLYRAEHKGNDPSDDAAEPTWLRWRAERLNRFAQRLHQQVKATDSTLIVSWAPSIYPWSLEEYLQDWPAWVRGGYADWVHMQVYRYSIADYEKTLRSQHADSVKIGDFSSAYPGVLINIGDYCIEPDSLVEIVRINRRLGYSGEVFFFYEGLRKNNDALARALLASVYQTAPIRLRRSKTH